MKKDERDVKIIFRVSRKENEALIKEQIEQGFNNRSCYVRFKLLKSFKIKEPATIMLELNMALIAATLRQQATKQLLHPEWVSHNRIVTEAAAKLTKLIDDLDKT